MLQAICVFPLQDSQPVKKTRFWPYIIIIIIIRDQNFIIMELIVIDFNRCTLLDHACRVRNGSNCCDFFTRNSCSTSYFPGVFSALPAPPLGLYRLSSAFVTRRWASSLTDCHGEGSG